MKMFFPCMYYCSMRAVMWLQSLITWPQASITWSVEQCFTQWWALPVLEDGQVCSAYRWLQQVTPCLLLRLRWTDRQSDACVCCIERGLMVKPSLTQTFLLSPLSFLFCPLPYSLSPPSLIPPSHTHCLAMLRCCSQCSPNTLSCRRREKPSSGQASFATKESREDSEVVYPSTELQHPLLVGKPKFSE